MSQNGKPQFYARVKIAGDRWAKIGPYKTRLDARNAQAWYILGNMSLYLS